MIKGIKIRLNPNNKQKTKLFESAGVARFAYNWTLNRQIENYKNGGIEYPETKEIKRLEKKSIKEI